MSGRHAAADDVDDEARAAAEPDVAGAHRADVPAEEPRKAPPPPRKRATRRATQT
ncbi:MAG TPA: hypothetical protein VNR36_03500 [Pseudolysinimonas sp.]|nr:hypothetical protein [Pseudolysinimonas sp.]